jgi:hypothetical protein
MSRSRKKTKIHGVTTARSEKQDKRVANRRLRRIVKQKVKADDMILPLMREVSSVWTFEKDGKTYYNGISAKEMRK